METSTKALLTLTILLMALMVRTEGGRNVPMKEEADTNGPQHTLTLGLLGGWGLGVLPWLGFGLGNLIPLLGGLPWLGLRHPGFGGFPWKKDSLDNDMNGYVPKGEGGAVSQSP